MKEQIKQRIPDILALLFFVLVSCAYFFPVGFQGKELHGGDTIAGLGAGHEAQMHQQKTGERTRWTNAIFGGMPTYQMAPSYTSTDSLRYVEKGYRFFLPKYIYLIFILLLGFYILMRVFNIPVWLSALGALVWAFSSYFFIIIGAGHLWKFITLAYIPPTIAGIILAYRGKYVLGSLVAALFASLQILSNHVQMTYYFLFVILLIVVAYFVQAHQNKTYKSFFTASGSLLIAAIIAVAINASSLYHTYEYSKETMRGKSELTKSNSKDQTESGLERSYITQWSYGIGETFSLLVPNVKGGASVPLMKNEIAAKYANPQYTQIFQQIGQYWGEQPGTSGPVYVGAFILVLFLLGCFIVKGPLKWALVAATLLSITLSWGKNFMGWTDFFIDYVPMYDKFRAVSSILVIAEFTIPLLAILGLHQLLKFKRKEDLKWFTISCGTIATLTLLFAVVPNLFFPSYLSNMEESALSHGLPAEHVQPVIQNLTEIRTAIFTADAWRSFWIIVIGGTLIYAWKRKSLPQKYTIFGIIVLCLIDLWGINKRYLNNEMFQAPRSQALAFQKTATDYAILQDTTLDYRVANLSLCQYQKGKVNPSPLFNENKTAYWHKSIGGYHAAKLRRYQEMIEHHISPEISSLFLQIIEKQGDFSKIDPTLFPVLNMLNTRYFIFPTAANETAPLRNPYAFGNAWFVNHIQYVANANEEINAVGQFNPLETAIIDRKFKAEIGEISTSSSDSLAYIKLNSYAPNRLVYETENKEKALAVFSEIYYPGWKVSIDGKEANYGRANYIFRAMTIPKGKHEIVFTYDPTSLHITESIAWIALGLLIISFILYIIKKRK